MRHRSSFAVLVLVMASLLVACSSSDPAAKTKAEQLVEAAQKSGVADGLTVEVAEALYGTDAAPVCSAFDGGLTSAERLILLGNPSDRRHKTITDHAIVYSGLVVETYCPEHLAAFRKVVADLDPYESDRLTAGQQ